MTKEKRKFYNIKEMRRQGLNYQERGEKIAGFKRVGAKFTPPVDNHITQPVKMVKKSFWRRIIDFFKSLFYGKAK